MKSEFRFLMKYGFILFVVIFFSCDVLYNQKKLKLAVATNDYASNNSAAHLKAFLENGGYLVEIVSVATTIEANELVANSGADITFVLNHSLFMPSRLGKQSNELRSIIPLFEPAMFVFAKDSSITETKPDIFSGKKIGIEKFAGEAHLNFQEIMQTAKIDSVEFTENWAGDFFHFWGTYHGKRAQNSIGKNWTPISIDDKYNKAVLHEEPEFGFHSVCLKMIPTNSHFEG